MSTKPRKRLVSKREYVKILWDDISDFMASFSFTVMMLGCCVFFFWLAWNWFLAFV